MLTDLRYAARALARHPGFTAAAVLVLATGIGASAAVFAIANAVLLSELPHPNASRLVRVFHENSPTNRWGLSVADVIAIREQQRSFEAFGALGFGSAAVTGAGGPQSVLVGRVTAGFLEAFQAPLTAGRLIGPEDESPGALPVAILSHAQALRLGDGAAPVVGRTVTVDGVRHTVIGVLAPGVTRLANVPAAVWTALTIQPPSRRGPFGIRGVGLLREGVTLESAATDLSGISRRIYPLWAAGFRDSTARYVPVPLRESIVGTAGRQVWMFTGAVVLVLLAAIANVATLMVVRQSARESELAVRAALGAGRARLARLVASEAAVIGVLAGVLALAIALAGVRLVPLVAPNLPRGSEVVLGAPELVIVGLLAALAGALVSLSPVIATLTGRGDGSLKADTQRTGTGRPTQRLRGALVVVEFALALPLLLSAGLLLNSFLRLQRVDPGFDPAGVVAVQISLPAARFGDDSASQAFWRMALDRIRSIPSIIAAGLTGGLPPDTQGQTNNFNLVAKPVSEGTAEYLAPWSLVTAGYFETLRIPLVEGRMFTPGDSGGAPPVVVVSRTWANRYFPEGSAVGQQLVSGGCYACPRTTVVGVVGDVKYGGLAGDGDGVYSPVAQVPQPLSLALVARIRGTPAEAFAALRRELTALDPELPVQDIVLADRVRASLGDPRRWTSVLGAFAGVALLLSALGIYGLMSYLVRQRRREIGVRLALGADPASIARMVVSRGLRYAVTGTAIGLGFSILAGRWVRSLLYGVAAGDPLTLVASAVLLLLVALAATLLPGIRAARIGPVEAIRAD